MSTFKRFVLVQLSLAAFLGMAEAGAPKLELDLTGSEYQRLLKTSAAAGLETMTGVDADLDAILRVGTRNLEWLGHINGARGDSAKLSFSTPETQLAYPVEQPKTYNPDLIQSRFDALVAGLPAPMKAVLLDGAPLTDNPPIDEKDYLSWGLKLDRVYQDAARWKLMAPWLGEMAGRQAGDIRGYYFFQKITDLKSQLERWRDLPADTKSLYRSYLIGMCRNNKGGKKCPATVDAQLAKGNASALYKKYFGAAKKLYDGFYNISARRDDVSWTSDDRLMQVPFVKPGEEFRSFLADNIEDEWKWNDWALKLRFVTDANPNATPHLVFEPGATPHVNELAGNEITMDQNAPLTEYNVRWTIRHEYGHVLGFPDCYHEFYDAEQGVMVSYQLDITDLMCSRRGHLKERHFTELKRVYR